jgi:hypothetical protein
VWWINQIEYIFLLTPWHKNPEGSSLHSQQFATGPYPEPVESNPLPQPVESNPLPQPVSLRSILIPSSHLRLKQNDFSRCFEFFKVRRVVKFYSFLKYRHLHHPAQINDGQIRNQKNTLVLRTLLLLVDIAKTLTRHPVRREKLQSLWSRPL